VGDPTKAPSAPSSPSPAARLAVAGGGQRQPRDCAASSALLQQAAGHGRWQRGQLGLHSAAPPERARRCRNHGDSARPRPLTPRPPPFGDGAMKLSKRYAGRAPRGQGRGQQRLLDPPPRPAGADSRAASRAARTGKNPGPALDEASRAAANRGSDSVGHQGWAERTTSPFWGGQRIKARPRWPAAAFDPAAFFGEGQAHVPEPEQWVVAETTGAAGGLLQDQSLTDSPPLQQGVAATGVGATASTRVKTGPAVAAAPAPAAGPGRSLGSNGAGVNGESGARAPAEGSTLRPESSARAHWPGEPAQPLRP